MVKLLLDDKPFEIEVDTGAAISIVSEDVFKSAFPNRTLQSSALNLRTFTGEVIKMLGELSVVVKYTTQASKELIVFVVAHAYW